MYTLIPWGRRQVPSKRTDDYDLGFPAQLSDLERVFDRFFGNLVPSMSTLETEFMPSLDFKETDKAIEISAELPGVDEKDIKVTLADNMLTISGEKKAEKEETHEGARRVERRYGSFMRSVPLLPDLDVDKVDAKYKNGILMVTIPKSPEYQKKVKSIQVKAESSGNGGEKQS